MLFKKQPPVERARAVEQSPSLMTRRLSGHLYSNLYLLVFVLYLVLPLVSNAIFEARLCESFSYDDTSGLRISFLLADLSLRCNSGPTWSSQTTSLDAYFWTLFTLWTILVPSCFLVLLLKVRSERRALRTSQIAWSTRFLWHDYRDEFLFWEIVDIWRKVRARDALSLACSTHPTNPNPPFTPRVTDLSHCHRALHRHGAGLQSGVEARRRHHGVHRIPHRPRRGPAAPAVG